MFLDSRYELRLYPAVLLFLVSHRPPTLAIFPWCLILSHSLATFCQCGLFCWSWLRIAQLLYVLAVIAQSVISTKLNLLTSEINAFHL